MSSISKMILGLSLVLFGLGCQEDEVVISDDSGAIDAVVLEYVQRFQAEAADRGVSTDLEGLEARLTDVDGENVIGQCISYSNGSREVLLDSEYWESSTDLGKELLVFHELGHCILGKGHNESQNANGTCTSIMHSGTGGCRFNYNNVNREAYLDELFED